jgi:hypothetical protein
MLPGIYIRLRVLASSRHLLLRVAAILVMRWCRVLSGTVCHP